ncbi:outer membrane beta-barrel protein [Ferruginibacter lapsinanis]|uniref:TonB-dependent receptor n=1 Tax=Ferruginibacter lapsinanis TaxID=563172 RepID=UPI001E4B2D89|nr:TonB-dependent receptor [Ferruginibacter lapsinanis]UEG48519.1 outer membrane beta-barrel protein [Ferruginibacter lapsinanis]
MIKSIVITSGFFLASLFVTAQDISLSGVLTDKSDESAIVGATIKLSSASDQAFTKSVATNATGNFQFGNLSVGSYVITISSVGYETISQKINLQASNKIPIPFFLTKAENTLADVVVTAKTPPVKQKNDTLEFAANQFKVNPDATAEDIIKKLPGIVVDKSGNVTAMGESVKKVTVDGRDFFGDDASAALKNLPADVIDKIQVFDRLSDQAQFTGFDDGNTVKTVNIVTKANMRNGSFGRFYAGIGTDSRYSGGGSYNIFKNTTRLSFVGMSNNINQQNFSSQDLLGISSGGKNSGSNNFIGQQSGISKTNAFGINYSALWGKKTEVTGSYFFNNSNTNNNQISNSEFYQTSGINQLNNEYTISGSNNYNHRINFRIEHKFDDKNSLNITPSFSYQKNNSSNYLTGTRVYSNGDPISNTINNSDRKTSGYNFNNNILYRHAFAKKGRTISFGIGTSVNEKQGDTYRLNDNLYTKIPSDIADSSNQFTDVFNNGYQLSANIAYTEPVGKKGQLQFNYSPSYSKSKSDQEVNQYDYLTSKYELFDTALSNKFDNIVTKQNIGTNYRVGSKDNMFTAGVSYQHTDLSSDETFPVITTVRKSFDNILPNLMWNKKFDAKNRIRIMFRSNTNTPSVSQLQNVINNTNPLSQYVGNPDLKQQYSKTLSTRYTFTNTSKSKSFFANLFLTQTNNYIGNATYIAGSDSVLSSKDTLYKGSQLSKPVNLDGYWTLRTFFTYAVPVSFIKSTVSFNAGYSYSKMPGLINNILFKANSNTYSGGMSIASNISQYIDFNLLYNANYNDVKNSNKALNSNYLAQTAGAQLNLLSKKGWFYNSDLTYQTYSGLSSGFNQDYWLLNAAIGKKFLKNQQGELKLSAFDILKQNQSITRTVTEAYRQDLQSLVLQQYFMLTFTYKLKTIGNVSQQKTNSKRNEYGPLRGDNGI